MTSSLGASTLQQSCVHFWIEIIIHLYPKEPDAEELAKGFISENDIFSRAEFGRGIIRLFNKLDHSATLILDAPWGTGKTVFSKTLAGEMRQEGFSVIEFDTN